MEKEDENKIPEEPELRVALYGIGSIGSNIARLLLKKRGVKVVGAIDAAADKVGRDLGEVIGAEEPLGITVTDNPDRLLPEVKADIVVHATSSLLKDVYPQLEGLVQHGVNVISTCEELSYPYVSDSDSAAELDRLAKKHGVTVLGTGINPGFLMDTLAITLTGVCQEIRHIKVERLIDAAKRRPPFQKKIGVGLKAEEFKEKIGRGYITGHVGLKESIAMIADALGWKLRSIEIDRVEPVIAERTVESEGIKVECGRVAGSRQSAYGIMDGKPVITLVFSAYVGAEEEYDSIMIEGTPSINEQITPCVHGDIGTAAIIVNSIPKVINATPGLKTMKDLPIPSAVLGDIRQYLERQRGN
jgi:4-hydroxy-tetrahydrodipicolinate reductase